VQDYKELDVWKKSVSLTTDLYKLTSTFPDTERFGLTSQIRRAATSIAANIAEGWGRGSRAKDIHFLTIARGSLLELETHLIVAQNLHFLTPEEFVSTSKPIEDIGKMLNRLIAVLRTRKQGQPVAKALNPEVRQVTSRGPRVAASDSRLPRSENEHRRADKRERIDVPR